MLCVYKPNSVHPPQGELDSYLSAIVVANNLKRHSPISFTLGVAKSSILSEAKDKAPRKTRDAQFCIHLW